MPTIDIRRVIAGKNPALLKIIPGPVIRYLERVVHVDELNEALALLHGRSGLSFVGGTLEYLGVSVDSVGEENLVVATRPTIVANHPLGGLDGVALMQVVGRALGSVKLPVNDLLLNFEGLNELFVPVNKHGSNLENVRLLEGAFSDEAPLVMQEIGRIRELEFRREGGGTGKSTDIDEFDAGTTPFRQIVAWDPLHCEIVGMYRFQPYAIELGRSVVNRAAHRAAMGLFAAWAGLGALVAEYPECHYFFGKFTIFPSYEPVARSILLRFIALHCSDDLSLIQPRAPCPFAPVHPACPECDIYSGESFDADYERMQGALQARGESIPPLVISYLRLSPSMQCFGTATNPHFGGVLETAMLIRIADIGPRARKRFINNYRSVNPDAIKRHRIEADVSY